jgi:hypothetical protein
MRVQPYILLFCALWILGINSLGATGAPSTYFNIYLPPNNDAVQRNVALIVTAIYDNTQFTITDDNADGDNDDTVSDTLMAGQSYVLYIKDNGINDDAQYASGGTLKRDGDYFIIQSSNLVFASMSTDSDWQHDFVPSVNKTSLGEKFIIYAPKISTSKRDLNIFAFEDNTTFTISKISTVPTTNTGFTNIDLEQKTIVRQRTINRGQDIIHYYQDGRDVMETGATYMIEANKPVSVQYGALWTNARDGGGYVPSSNGSSSGELFYFAVPYQANGEQEIRVVSWQDNNNVVLERYDNGNWVNVKSWTLDRKKPADWVGKKNGNATYPTVFRISCTNGKKVSVFECNWMETGSIGTSDMASMVSSEAGTDSGKEFLVYLLPPARQQNVVNPFTGQFFGGNFTHCYLYAGNQTTNIVIKDAKTNGAVINRSYTIQPNRYVDAFFSEAEWKSIYNGTGNADTGPDRPYIFIEADHDISVMNANTNDNWMMYFGSSLEKSFSQSGGPSQSIAIPGDTITYTANLILANQNITSPKVEVFIGSGGIPLSSELSIGSQTYIGQITAGNSNTCIAFTGLPTIIPNSNVNVVTDLVISPSFNDGKAIPDNTVLTIESVVTGQVNGQIQQSSISSGIQNNSANQSNLLFSNCISSGALVDVSTDSWNAAWVDYNNDGWEDLYVADRNPSKPNLLYSNNGTSFTNVTSGPLVNTFEKTIASVWGDYNNDGFVDVFVVNATGTKSRLYKNTNGNFVEVANSGIDTDPQYFHGAAWFDMDNDGFLDLIVANFFETRFHQMYRNNGNGAFTRILDNPIVAESNRSTMLALVDYDNDGLVDVFIPNGPNKPNSLFKNLGNGAFRKITTGVLVTDLGNSVGAAWGDYNNDGFMDILVLNASRQANYLYKNLGNGNFESVSNTILSDTYADTHSATWIDHDNDGDLDVFITNDEGASFYYINNGDETFSKKVAEVITSDIGNAMGVAAADYNKDGKTDLFVTTHSNQKNALYCNQSANDNNFINIRLVGVYSNKSAIGAKIKVVSGGRRQYRAVLPVQGLGSQNSLRQHFGLGQAAVVDTIEITWPSGYVQRIAGANVNQFMTITEAGGNRISGFAFSDDNNNCTWDAGEAKVENIRFTAGANATVITSRQDGAFDLSVPAGSYAFSTLDNDFWEMDCSAEVTATGSNNTYTLNLPLKKVVNAADLGLGFGITAWRRGFANESLLQYFNQGTNAANNCTLELTYPAGVNLVYANIPWTEKTGNKYIWNIATIPAGKEFTIQLRDSVTLGVAVGQQLAVSAQISTATSESNTSNNTYAEMMEIVGAIDPNDILVSPKGKGAEGFIPQDQLLRYHIRFQNVGTYYASRVVLENQLSPYLDWSTFKIESVSHEGYNFTLLDNGLLEVRFNNIELPDSNTNEPASHGFFIYTIKPRKDLNGGERIENNALIAFDYEDPLRTNTVVNTIKYAGRPETRHLTIFPNPASDVVYIVGDSGELDPEIPLMHTIRIMNALGATVREISNKEAYQITINIPSLTPGIYTVLGYGYDGKIYQGKLVKM